MINISIKNTFLHSDGQRVTTARAYLKPKSERPNFSLKTNTHVTRVLLNGKDAYGVEYIDENGEAKTVNANKEVRVRVILKNITTNFTIFENTRYFSGAKYFNRVWTNPSLHNTFAFVTYGTIVMFKGDKIKASHHGALYLMISNFQVILCAGALNSPHILLLSGIGPKETLDNFNIPIVADLPVGKNLRNHVGITLKYILTELNNTQVLDWFVFTEYILERKGPMSGTAITQVSWRATSSSRHLI